MTTCLADAFALHMQAYMRGYYAGIGTAAVETQQQHRALHWAYQRGLRDGRAEESKMVIAI